MKRLSRRKRTQAPPFGRRLFLVGVCLMVPALGWGGLAQASDGMVVYASPTGLATNSGTATAPLSLAAAQAWVRSKNASMTDDITVFLEPGIYRLTRPLAFGPADSGSGGFDVNWAANDPGTVTITGEQPVTGWTEADTSKDIWSAPLPEGVNSRQLYVNGTPAVMTSGRVPVGLKQTSYGYQASSNLLSTWPNPSEIDFVWTGDLGPMVQSECPVASIKGKRISIAQPCWNNSTRRHWNWVGYTSLHTPAYMENAYELLDQPGQFYLDRSARRLYYIPRAGQEDMNNADVEIPLLSSLVSLTGSNGSPVHNIKFEGIEFSGATWLQPGSKNGFSEVQSGYTLTGPAAYRGEGLCHYASSRSCPYGSWTAEPAAVSVAAAQNIAFTGDEFVQMGGAGLCLGDATQNSSVSDSVFTEISGNGVEVGGVDAPVAKPALQTIGNAITDNHIYGIGGQFPGAAGILQGYAAGSLISHNQVDHVPYSGISVGWGGWPDKGGRPPVANYSHGTVISDNLVENYMEALTDGGGIYTLGIQGSSFGTGEMVAGNVIHGQVGWSSALKSDNGATFVTYEHNVSYDNTYDWDGNHRDYRPGHVYRYDPQNVSDNYLQQGYPETSPRGSIASSNLIIDGPDQAPKSIVSYAGVQPADASILLWSPASSAVPGQPTAVSALYAFGGRAYVTWKPSYVEGSGPVTSYRLTACPIMSGTAECQDGPSVDVTESEYMASGYEALTGLSPGGKYAFEVTAANAFGAGTPSILSPTVRISHSKPSKPGRVSGVIPMAGKDAIRLLWYAPKSSSCPSPSYDSWSGCKSPVLAYLLKSSTGKEYVASSLSQLVMSNHQGRVLDVVGGLQAGTSYRFTIRAENPAGLGPAMTSYSTTPYG